VKYLVTGAAGFIGHEVVTQLLAQNHEVVGVDNLNDYYDLKLKEKRLADLSEKKKFEFYQIDIEDMTALESVFSLYEFDAVLNLAARAGVRYSMENPDIYVSTNVQGNLNLLNLAKKYQIKKYVLASTSSLYAGKEMPYTENLDVSGPISPYAATKKAAETMCYTYHHLYDMDISIVRYFTVYGPMSRPDMAQLRFMKWIDEEKEIELFGDGEQARDFTHVKDIARGTILALKPLGYEIINLGGGQNPISINTMIRDLEKLLDKKAKVDKKPSHKADMQTTWADISKAKRLLGWEPVISFEEGLKDCVNYYLEHIDFYKDIQLN
tara:strand:+ start:21089 stop:22060 length:972 start_codon:yes stop_codon:yes gene_type:complete